MDSLAQPRPPGVRVKNLDQPADIAAYACAHDALLGALPPALRHAIVLLEAPRDDVRLEEDALATGRRAQGVSAGRRTDGKAHNAAGGGARRR